jgi:redox-sensitive bicupin YhaK (pirin superfamily)
MTAGHGVSHSEEPTGRYRGPLQGIQLWVAQPDATRDGPPAFEHRAELPSLDVGDAVATVLVGELGDVAAPTRRDTEHLGVDLAMRPGTALVPARTDYEYGLVVLDGAVTVDGTVVEPGSLAVLGTGRDEVALHADQDARAVLLGGVPLPEPPLMWWNYVARTRSEIVAAHASWQADDGRFGTVASHLARVDVAGPPWPSV